MRPQHIPDWQSDVSQLERFSRVRLIVVDLDGTFVRPSTSILFPSLRELQRSLSHPNYQVGVTVATGRAWAGAKPIIEELSISRTTPIILYNGAIVIEHESQCILSQQTIPRSTVEQGAATCKSFGVPVYSYWFDDPLTAAFHGGAPERVFATGRFWSRDLNGLDVYPWSSLPTDSNNCVAIVAIPTRKPLNEGLTPALDSISEITCTSSGNRYIEIRPVGVNKGQALRIVAEHQNIALDEVLALGDADNDAEMLQIAGIGVSVNGASEVALRSSDYTCKYGAAEGAVELMRLVKHAKRYFGKESRR